MKAQKDFTLIEPMIVVAIIGILTATAVPQYQNYVVRSEDASTLAAINPLKTTVEESLLRGIAGSKIKIGTTVSTATETYVGIASGVNKLGVIAAAIEDSGVGNISFAFQTGTSSSKNATKAITPSHITDGVWICRSTQDEMFIPKDCTK